MPSLHLWQKNTKTTVSPNKLVTRVIDQPGSSDEHASSSGSVAGTVIDPY